MSIAVRPERRKTRAEVDIDGAFATLSAARCGDFSGRADAFARFAAAGLPHRRVEPYHWTDLRSLLPSVPPAAAPGARATVEASVFAGVAPARFVLVDGFHVPALSDLAGLGDGVAIASVAAAIAAGTGPTGLGARTALPAIAGDPMVALTEAFFTDGVVLRVAPGARLARPLEIVHLASGAVVSAHVRHVIEIGAGAEATLFETHAGPAGVAYHAHGLTELTVGADAAVTLIDHQREGDAATRFASLAVVLDDRAWLDHTLITLGARLARTQVFARLGAGCDLQTRGATLVRGRTHADATLVVEHAGPGSVSRELYKSAVDDEARSVFQGRIAVETAAQQTDGRMQAHAVLLSDRAEAMAKPELEIFADDVACAHGATVSEIDDTLKFYLMSRGIPAAETEKLLIRAFLGEVTDAIALEPVRAAIEAEIDAWIDARTARGDARP